MKQIKYLIRKPNILVANSIAIKFLNLQMSIKFDVKMINLTFLGMKNFVIYLDFAQN